MIKIMGFCNDNLETCVRVYAERFPNRRTPDPRTFARVERSLRDAGKSLENLPNGLLTVDVLRFEVHISNKKVLTG
mgnify:CR=1 FL=1